MLRILWQQMYKHFLAAVIFYSRKYLIKTSHGLYKYVGSDKLEKVHERELSY